MLTTITTTIKNLIDNFSNRFKEERMHEIKRKFKNLLIINHLITKPIFLKPFKKIFNK